MTMAEDLAVRSAEMRWPEGLTPAEADAFSSNRLRLDVSLPRVWKHLVAAPLWPSWYPNSQDVVLVEEAGTGDTLTAGTLFHWNTFGGRWEARVVDFEPPSADRADAQIVWTGGEIDGPHTACHGWSLHRDGAGCVVVTDEVRVGADAGAAMAADEDAMHRGHDLWLAALHFVTAASDG